MMNSYLTCTYYSNFRLTSSFSIIIRIHGGVAIYVKDEHISLFKPCHLIKLSFEVVDVIIYESLVIKFVGSRQHAANQGIPILISTYIAKRLKMESSLLEHGLNRIWLNNVLSPRRRRFRRASLDVRRDEPNIRHFSPYLSIRFFKIASLAPSSNLLIRSSIFVICSLFC